MPRKSVSPDDELAALRAQESVLEDQLRLTNRALTANRARQRDIIADQQHSKRVALGTALDGLGLTVEQIKALVEQQTKGRPFEVRMREDGEDSSPEN
jgi:hypothetical protein